MCRPTRVYFFRTTSFVSRDYSLSCLFHLICFIAFACKLIAKLFVCTTVEPIFMSLEKYCILGNRHVSALPASISSAILQVVCICNLFIVNVNKYSLSWVFYFSVRTPLYYGHFSNTSLPRRRSLGFVKRSGRTNVVRGAGTRDEPLRTSAWEATPIRTPALLRTVSNVPKKSSYIFSLRKQPLLLPLRRWGRFARNNVCDSATEIPYRWRKICAESGQKRWLVDGVVTLF